VKTKSCAVRSAVQVVASVVHEAFVGVDVSTENTFFSILFFA
jgi:hypothetical protein